MNEREMEQLSRLFHASVGEPPCQVSFHAVRRQAMRRRFAAAVTVTAALALAGSVGIAVAANASRTTPAVTKVRAAIPRFYFETDFVGQLRHRHQRSAIRSTATGKVTATFRCPGPRPDLVGAAADGHGTFFMACLSSVLTDGVVQTPVASKIYRFRVTDTGHITGFGLIPGGDLKGILVRSIGASGNGTEVAVSAALSSGNQDNPTRVLVVNAKTGRRATWLSNRMPGGVRLFVYEVSLTRDGKTLGALGFDRCVQSDRACKNPGEQMVVVRNANRGGRFERSGRVVFSQPQVAPFRPRVVGPAYISPDGATIVVSTISPREVLSVNSAVTGKRVHVLFRSSTTGAGISSMSVDPSSGLVLIAGAVKVAPHAFREFNGWLDRGKLIPEQPVSGLIEMEIW